MSQQVIFSLSVVLIGALGSAVCALVYFQRVRLDRPAIGVFNPGDIAVLMFFIISLPLLYVVLPQVMLIGFLVVTFVSALYFCLRPLMPARVIWPIIAVTLITDIIIAHTLLGTQIGWQIYWVLTSTVVLLAAVGVSNLYVQGGMRMRHVAWFALILGFYDAFFAFVFPVTQKLADRFEGLPLDPSIGFKMGPYIANIGLGDLLMFSLFTVAAYKGFGRKGAATALAVISVFGVFLPSMAPLFIAAVIRGSIGIVVPAQIFFGPAAFVAYRWLARSAPERSMREWYEVQAEMDRERELAAQTAKPTPQPVPVS